MNIVLQTLFYSVVLHLTLKYGIGYAGSSNAGISYFLFPLYHSEYWYITIYVGLMVIAPYLSLLASKLSKNNYLTLLIILFVLNFAYLYSKPFGGEGGHSLGLFIFLYFLAGYVKIYGIPGKLSDHAGKIATFLLCGLCLAVVSLNLLRYFQGAGGMKLMGEANNGFLLFLSFFIFIFFKKRKCYNKYVTKLVRISPYLLAVYLIQMHPELNEYLWMKLIPTSYSCPIILHCLIVSLLILSCCIIIDYFRNKLFGLFKIEKLIGYMVSKLPLEL